MERLKKQLADSKAPVAGTGLISTERQVLEAANKKLQENYDSFENKFFFFSLFYLKYIFIIVLLLRILFM